MNKTNLISIEHISKHYPKKEGHKRVDVLNDISFDIQEGAVTLLLGPSGCGKSTLLRIIAKLDKQSSGSIQYADNYDPKKISFVFQDFGVFPWLTVEQNVSLNLIGDDTQKNEIQKRVKDILEIFGLTSFKDSYPKDLSGGMRQRTGLARAFVTQPQTIFLDEPFSELDFFTAGELRKILLTLKSEYGTTIVMVSHYIDEAVALADTIVVFTQRPSTIHAVIPNTLERPRNPRSQEFFALEDKVSECFTSKKDEK